MTDIESSSKTSTVKKRRGKLQRISANQLEIGRELLHQISLRLEENDQTQRQIFIKLLPQIYVLKEKVGYKFKFITRCLKNFGLNLAESSVRAYYSKMIPKCNQEFFNTAELLFSEYKSALKEKGISIDKENIHKY